MLGQDAWRENGQEDPVLAQALARLGREDAKQQGWLQLLAEPLPCGFYGWLTERFERRVPPDWLSALGEMPWSAVFTSSLDPALKELFSKRQRPELVLTNAEMPPAIRSRVRPPIYHLFGHAGTPDPRAQPHRTAAHSTADVSTTRRRCSAEYSIRPRHLAASSLMAWWPRETGCA